MVKSTCLAACLLCLYSGSVQAADACEQARIDWAILNEGMPVYYTEDGSYRPNWHGDAYAGKRRYIDDDKRPALITEAEDRVFRYCDNPEDMNKLARTYDDWIQGELCEASRILLAAAEQGNSRTSRDEVEARRAAVRKDCKRR